MTTLYDPPGNRYKIEVNSMGHYTVTRLKTQGMNFNESETESKYLQFDGDIMPFHEALEGMPFMPADKRNQAYVDLINSQFE